MPESEWLSVSGLWPLASAALAARFLQRRLMMIPRKRGPQATTHRRSRGAKSANRPGKIFSFQETETDRHGHEEEVNAATDAIASGFLGIGPCQANNDASFSAISFQIK
jgi:hypothetical protein